jgi:hypothetical protein
MTTSDARGAESTAEVLRRHRLHGSMNICTGCDWRPAPNAGHLREQHEAHLAAALAEAGIGPVAQARAEGAEAVVAAVEVQAGSWGREARRYRGYAAGSKIREELQSIAQVLDGCGDDAVRAARAAAAETRGES